MKGIAHFVTGIAIATLFPEVVERAGDGSILPVLGGVAAILPDTLDFRFVRHFERHDLEIDPGPKPNPDKIARQVADAMRHAYETRVPRSVMLHTIRLGPDRWRQYVIRFDPQRQDVAVRIGPVVDTGQNPLPDFESQEEGEAHVPVDVPLVNAYADEVEIDIFSGPSFTFERRGDRLHVHFLDWHRRWSHSLTLGAALGVGVGSLAALLEALFNGGATRLSLWVGLVVGLGFLAHVLQDQLGFLGSNLLYPLTQARMPGLRWLRSGDAVPNCLTVWAGLVLILFNLDRFSSQPQLNPWWAFLGVTVALPIALLIAIYQWRRRRRGLRSAGSLGP